MPTVTDCRIAAELDFIITNKETWAVEITVVDSSNVAINVTGFTVGPLVIYDGLRDTVLHAITDGVFIEDGIIKINEEVSGLRKKMVKGNYYECPLYPANGPKALLHGRIKVDGKN
jgi:hypothetical protein